MGGATLAIGMLVSSLLFGLLAGSAGSVQTAPGVQTVWGAPNASKTVHAFSVTGPILAGASDGSTLSGGTYGYELAAAIAALGFPVSGSAAGFFLIEVGDPAAARRVLLAHGCLIRDCTSFGLPHHVRVSPRHPEQNRRLIEGFAALAGSMRDGATS